VAAIEGVYRQHPSQLVFVVQNFDELLLYVAPGVQQYGLWYCQGVVTVCVTLEAAGTALATATSLTCKWQPYHYELQSQCPPPPPQLAFLNSLTVLGMHQHWTTRNS
jgi:hypothetical protein